MMSEYNGWTNKETWLVTLWLMPEIEEYIVACNSDDTSSSYMQNMAKNIEEYVGTRVFHNLSDEVGEDIGGLTSDLLRMCLHDVDWYEIAEHVWEDLP